MSLTLICILGFILVVLFIIFRVHIAFSLGTIGIIGCYYILGPISISILKTIPWAHTAKFELSVLPLFILMGMFISNSGIAVQLYECAFKWLGNIRGGLLLATSLSAGIFGACCGSIIATTTTFSKISYPHLIKHKYDPGVSCGVIAASGTQSALIPPSALLVFYGILTELSIGKLLVAALVPGILSVIIYMLIIWFTIYLFPNKGPGRIKTSFKEKVNSTKGVWPIPFIFIFVVGGLFLGIFTPTEAGAVGALFSLLVSIFKVGSKKVEIIKALKDAVNSTAMIFIILIGAFIFSRFISLTRIPNVAAEFLISVDMKPMLILSIILFGYCLLGCVMNATGMVAITIPVIYPIIESLGFSGIWFGILLVKVVEIGLITPPIGLSCFIVQNLVAPDLKASQVFKGVVPFHFADVITLIILVIFPQITLWLPNMM